MSKTSTEINSIARYVGEAKALELVAQAGFDCYDFSMHQMAKYDYSTSMVSRQYFHPLKDGNPRGFAKEIRRIGESLGIACNQSHAPYPIRCEEIRRILPLAIECTAIAGGDICVIHPNNNLSPLENAAIYKELLPVAKSFGIRIATENMWNWDGNKGHAVPAACSQPQNFLELLERVGDPDLVACLDIGHSQMKGLGTTPVEMIETLGQHIWALHLHDNDGLHDAHELPYTGVVDYEAVLKALAKVGYRGVLTLEAYGHLPKHSPHNIQRGVMEMGETARQLAKEFDRIGKQQ